MVSERSPFDPRPAKANPVGTVKRVVADDGTVEIWHLVEVVDGAADRQYAIKRIAQINFQLEELDDWNPDAVAQAAVDFEKDTRKARREVLEQELTELEERLK